MKQIPVDENNISKYNKKAIKFIIILVICGIVAGIALSSLFVYEANERIKNFDEDLRYMRNQGVPFEPESIEPLSFSDIILPALGVIVVSISTFLLVGLIIVYLKIFLSSNSRYIVGLLFFLFPLLIQSVFFLNALRSLFVSSRIPFFSVRESIGFSIGGLGGMLVILSIFEIVGLTILLYLSNE